MNVEELKEASLRNLPIKGTYIISKIEEKTFKAKSGFFLQCELSDRTGTIRGVVWDRADILKECLKNKQVFKITGEATRYNDNPQIVIKTAVKEEIFDPSDFMPSLDKDSIEDHAQFLKDTAPTINNPVCQSIWSAITEPGKSMHHELLKKFYTCPGGVGDIIHHAYLGGLLEHTSSMIKIAENICKNRPILDRDIVLTGCLVHDIGKIHTYDWNIVIEMSDQGRLLHHTTLGVEILTHLMVFGCGRYLGLPGEDPDGSLRRTVMLLKHIIVSHHQDEGIRKPMTAEAEAVAQIDSIDAALKGIQQYLTDPGSRVPGEGNWTKYCHLTGRQYFIPRELEESQEQSDPADKSRVIAPGMVEEKLF